MKRLIAITLILIAAVAWVTVKYFNSLGTAGMHAGNVIRTIPDNAALVFEFTNENSLYDIYKGNTLLGNLVGEEKLIDLDTIKNRLINNPALNKAFDNRNIFISIHPAKDGEVRMLLTTSVKDVPLRAFEELAKQRNTGMLITPLRIGEKSGYNIYFQSLKKRLYLLYSGNNVFSASFSKELINDAANYIPQREQHVFMLLPDQQNANSLINLYVNYQHLDPLFGQLFKENTDIFKPFRMLPALAALNINFKNNAVMFAGYTNIETNKPGSYLNIFANQQPIVNNLKDIYPSTTAYAIDMAISNGPQFFADLSTFQQKAGLQKEKNTLLAKVKQETGINIKPEFEKLVSNEFGVVITRFQERFAIITVKNGSLLRPFMTNISTMVTDDIGQFKFQKLPYFLLGDAFSAFRRPYFRIIDNYLILANSQTELTSYADTYLNRKFLSKTNSYLPFDDLLAERSNISFFLHFKNAQQILKQSLKDDFYLSYKDNDLSWRNFYAASFQFGATDKNFYTNFCLLKNTPDSTASPKND